jgi:hypothetical protein
MNYRIIESQNVFLVQTKKAWYTRWRYTKQKGSTVLPRVYETKRGAQAAINVLKRTV